MRFWLTLSILALAPAGIAGALMAQGAAPLDAQQRALRDAKAKALTAERRSEFLRQEASNAENAADRLVALRAVLAADMDAAEAQIAAANARIAIIGRRQQAQQAQLGRQSEPMLRLNAALQQMTARPTALMIVQPGQRSDYIHLRAVMATVQPEITRRTRVLRQQIALHNELRAQELVALKSLDEAKGRLQNRRASLARLESSERGRAGELSADAAAEFELVIAQGERARDIVGRMDSLRLGGARAAELAMLDGPATRPNAPNSAAPVRNNAYLLPARGGVASGFNELNPTGYRERGMRLAVEPSADIAAPAAGRVIFAGKYRSYGQIVIIEHGSGWSTLITDLASLRVVKGQRVDQGAILGIAGDKEPEIGIELRKNGRVMDVAAMLL